MLSNVRDIYKYRELLGILIQRNLKIRYKGSALGFFWSLLSPLFLIVIYSVFLRLLKVPIELPVLVSGIIIWQFLSLCLGDSLGAIVGNANLVTKTAFPRIILPVAMVLANAINFLLSSTVLLAYLLIVKVTFGPVYLLPVMFLSQLALCLGMALIIASANVFFRDTEHILSVVLLAWFFLSPVVYTVQDVGAIASDWARLSFLNPMAGIITGYRAALMSVVHPGWGLLAGSMLVGWLVLVVGVFIFNRTQARFAEVL